MSLKRYDASNMEWCTRFGFMSWIVKLIYLICLFLCTNGKVSTPSELSGAAQLTESVNLNRVEAMTKACDSLGDPPALRQEQLQHMLVDETHRLLYCYVPKVLTFINIFSNIFKFITERFVRCYRSLAQIGNES